MDEDRREAELRDAAANAEKGQLDMETRSLITRGFKSLDGVQQAELLGELSEIMLASTDEGL